MAFFMVVSVLVFPVPVTGISLIFLFPSRRSLKCSARDFFGGEGTGWGSLADSNTEDKGAGSLAGSFSFKIIDKMLTLCWQGHHIMMTLSTLSSPIISKANIYYN